MRIVEKDCDKEDVIINNTTLWFRDGRNDYECPFGLFEWHLSGRSALYISSHFSVHFTRRRCVSKCQESTLVLVTV